MVYDHDIPTTVSPCGRYHLIYWCTIIYESANVQAQLIISFLNTVNILSWTVTQ